MKITVLLLFFSMIFYLYKVRDKFFFLPLFAAIFFWPLAAHSLACSFLYLLVTEKSSLKIKFRIVLLSIASCIAFFFVAVYDPAYKASGNEVAQVFLRYKSFRIIFGTIIYDIMAFALAVSPFLALVIYMKLNSLKNHFRLILAIFIAVFIASVTNAITIGNLESFQFFINLSSPVIALVYGAGLYHLGSGLRHFRSGILVALAITFYSLYAFGRIFHNNCATFNVRYSADYVNFVRKIRDHSWRGVSIIKPDGYFKGTPHLNQTGAFVYLLKNSCITPVNNSENLRVAKEDGIRKMNLDGPFLQYVSKSGSNDTTELRKKFIREKGINFLVVHAEKNIQDYPELNSMFKLVCRDKVSGEKLYFPVEH